MTTFRLRQRSFFIKWRDFVGVGPDGKPKYKPYARKVHGEEFRYMGRDFGVYRAEHTVDMKRKYDYIIVDIASGLEVCRGARKCSALALLEDERFMESLQDIFSRESFKGQIEVFKKLKREIVYGKD